MSATVVVRRHIADYATWRAVYDELEPLRAKHGCTAKRVLRLPEDANDLQATHDFPSTEQASGFVGDPALGAAMQRGGVDGRPRIEIFASV